MSATDDREQMIRALFAAYLEGRKDIRRRDAVG